MKNIEIVTDQQIAEVWGNSNFGDISPREVVNNSVLKYAAGYATGHTAMCILHELGLLNKHSETLTKKGKEYLFYTYATTSL